MSNLQNIESELTKAMKARDQVRVDALRLVKATVKNKEIELIHPLSETEFFSVLQTMVKQRKESIEMFAKGGRTDLVAKEEGEIAVIEAFLPKAMGDAEIDAMIRQSIADTKASGPKDMGLVMKALKEKTAGRVDGKKLSEKVRNLL